MPEPVDVIYTVNGGPRLSRRLDEDPHLALGYESHRSPPPNGDSVAFVDWPFNRERAIDPRRHVDVVKREVPRLAVAPDVDGTWALHESLEIADRLYRYVQDTVIVVPKTVHPAAIPARYRAGLPLADWGSDDARNEIADYRAASTVHFLGGSPARQLAAADVVRPASIDSTAVGKAAAFGDIWTSPATPQYQSGADPWYAAEYGDRVHQAIATQRYSYLDRVLASLRNVVLAWADRYDYRNRITYDDWPAHTPPGISALAYSVAGRAPPPCQHPDCLDLAVPATGYTACTDHHGLV